MVNKDGQYSIKRGNCFCLWRHIKEESKKILSGCWRTNPFAKFLFLKELTKKSAGSYLQACLSTFSLQDNAKSGTFRRHKRVRKQHQHAVLGFSSVFYMVTPRAMWTMAEQLKHKVFEPTYRDSTQNSPRTGIIWEVKVPLGTFFILETYSVSPQTIYFYIDNDTVDNLSLLLSLLPVALDRAGAPTLWVLRSVVEPAAPRSKPQQLCFARTV